MLKKGDIILVIAVLVVILSWVALKWFFLNNSNDKIAVIRQNGKIIKEIDIDAVNEAQRINITGDYHEVILVEKGRIRFEEADCPDTLCVKTGWLTKPGDAAACLPNRATIKIEGNKAKVDGVTY